MPSAAKVQKNKLTQSAQDKYERILNSAAKLFAEKGFHGTSVPEVAKAAGVAAGTIYLYFENKEQLVNAVFQSSKQKFQTYLAQDFQQGVSLEDMFNAVWNNTCAFAQKYPDEFYFLELHEHSKYLNRESKRIEISVLAPFRLFIIKGKKENKIKDLPAIMLVAMIWGMFVGLFKADVYGYSKLTDEVFIQAKQLCWEMITK